MATEPIPEPLATVIRDEIVSSFSSAYSLQEWQRRDSESAFDTFTHDSRGRFSEDETQKLLQSVSEIAHPYGRAPDAAAAVEIEDAGTNYGCPSYRAAAVVPTDGPTALAISWRFTIPYRETVITEIENVWLHTVGEPLVVPAPLAECEPLTVGTTALKVGPDTVIFMENGAFDPAEVEDILKPRVYIEGGLELLTDKEIMLLKRVMRAIVGGDRVVLDEIGAFLDGRDPYMWTHDYGRWGEVHFVMPPGEVTTWDVGVLHVDDRPDESDLIVGMWTLEEGASSLSLEMQFFTDETGASVRGEFENLHVM